MYLKSIIIENFRKFRDSGNKIEFVNAEDYKKGVEIASKTTLIIGKNNSGKTTVIEALRKIIRDTKFYSTDFNFHYLKDLMKKYDKNYLDGENVEVPCIQFILNVGIEDNNEDLLTNIIPFMSLDDVNKSEVEIRIRWQVKDKELFINEVKLLNQKHYRGNMKFDRFLELIDKTEFNFVYVDKDNNRVKDFSIKNLIEIEPIEANKITNDNCLSEAFQKIINYRYNSIEKESYNSDLDKEIVAINRKLTKRIKKNHTDNINESLCTSVLDKKCQVSLKSDLNLQKLIKHVIKYEYIENEEEIPENQFGLGYTNLMMIIAKIISYMEKYPETSFNSKVNLITIEEPETFMHPQMQEHFIKNINDIIESLLISKDKHVNSQIIITTHSSHILNTKIHTGNSFDNINYITNFNGNAKSVCLNDNLILGFPKDKKNITFQEKLKLDQLKFLKKHIKFQVSDLFFADAVIFVEGITEYTLLQYYIDKNERINKYHISLLLVNGAHAKVYDNLIIALGIPALIITDIDIKREKLEKGEVVNGVQGQYLQITDINLGDRVTTNATLKYFSKGISKVKELIKNGYIYRDNMMVTFQIEEKHGNYSTSFEEAFILCNISNNIVRETLKKVKGEVYDEIVENASIINYTYKLQKKLSDSKSDFANTLLYKILTCEQDNKIPKLPRYIEDGLEFLAERLEG